MKRHKFLIAFPAALGLLLTGLFLCGLSVPVAGTPADIPTPTPPWDLFWPEWFSNDPPPNTYITATTGSGVIDSGSFLLTQNISYQRGRIFYLTPTLMDEFSASFSLYLGDSVEGADGAAFIFCPSYNYAPDGGGTLDASCPGGYIVAFDTYEFGGGEFVPDLIYLAHDDIFHRLVSVPITDLDDGLWHNAMVVFNQGTITVTLDGSNVIAGFAIPDYEPFLGYFGFSAAAGLWHNEQLVDNIGIQAEYVATGFLDGHVYDADTLEPIADATVTGERQEGGSWSADTDPNGYYSMLVRTGTYTVTAETDSLIDFATGVEVLTDEVTTQDLYLAEKVTFEPTPLHVTLDWQTAGSVNATLQNHQLEEYDFLFSEKPGGFIPLVQGEEICSAMAAWPGPDGYGYTGESVDYEWIEISSSGIPIPNLGDDDYEGPFPIGFSYNFYGNIWNEFYASSNGFISFDSGSASIGNQCPLPNSTLPDNIISIMWDDLYPNYDTGGVYYQTFDSCPVGSGRCLVVEYANWAHYVIISPYPSSGTWEAILFENGDVQLQYLDGGSEDGSSATSGIEGNNASANYGLTYACDSSGSLVDSTAIYFAYPDVTWFGQEPLSGTVPASNAEPGELSASMLFTATYATGVDQPGDYYTTLLVEGDPTLQVPVTMTVLPPVDMGSVTGSVTDNCTDDPIAGVQLIILYGDPITKTWTDEAGNYTAWLFEGSYELTFSVDGYLSTTQKVDIFGGQETTLDVSLAPERACIEVYPDELEAWVLTNTPIYPHPHGLDIINNGGEALNFEILEGGELIEAHGGFTSASGQRTEEGSIYWNYRNEEGVEVEMSDSGTMVAYPGSYQYAPDVPTTQANILVYTDDWVHPTPNTLVQQAIARLGVPATVYVDNDYAGFETALTTDGPWDLVIWSGENYFVSSTLMPKLLAYVQAGGKLAATYWRQLDFPSDPLWNEMGFQYISNYITPPPAYWWEPSHPIFNNPESAPEWLTRVANSGNSNGTKLEPLPNGLAVAGYTITSEPDEAGMVIRDDGFTVYKGIRDVSTNADDDIDGVLDGVELWENIITGLLEVQDRDIPWVWEEPITGTVPALSTFNVDILFSSVLTSPLTLGTYTATLWIHENDPVTSYPQIPVSMHVVEAFVDPAPSFETNAALCFGETAVFTNTSLEGMPPTEYYLWDFGDGVTMTSTTTETVTHDYAAAGVYTVSLTAHQKQTDVEVIFTDTIQVKPLPLADFSYTVDGLAVNFSNTSANATSYAWDFGDGATSTLENPTHTYAAPGDYLVSLTAYGECGMDQIEKTVSAGYHKNYLPLVYR
jgi:hypothetical protein